MFELIIAWLSFFTLGYIYVGYWLLLVFICYFKCKDTFPKDNQDNQNYFLPSITVLITAFNEEKTIKARIDNILSCSYPDEQLKILVASDASTDHTDEIVKNFRESNVLLFRPDKRVGKSDTQNQAIKQIKTDFFIFTDADTEFDKLFLQEIIKPFSDPRVGGVDGNLLFVDKNKSNVSQGQGFYWKQELQIRTLESQLSILAVATGACLAVRRDLFHPMKATVGEDCLIPLDIVSQDYKMIHAGKAIAYDEMPSDSGSEFRTRVRMTLRNWQGTWMYPDLLNPFKNPEFAFALWSHKILRWLSPLFLICWLFFGLLSLSASIPYVVVGWIAILFILAAGLGTIANYFKKKIPVVGMVYSFVLANLGFLIGIWRALSKQHMTTYK